MNPPVRDRTAGVERRPVSVLALSLRPSRRLVEAVPVRSDRHSSLRGRHSTAAKSVAINDPHGPTYPAALESTLPGTVKIKLKRKCYRHLSTRIL